MTIYTIGTSNRSLQEFLAALEAFCIATAVDVRSFPTSRRYEHFKREALGEALAAAGIRYVWMGDRLGGYREGGYQAHMRTEAFAGGISGLEALASEAPTAFFCAEKLPPRCHRRFISGELEARGWEVVHILDPASTWRPEETPTLF
jgi:uncharacterized protein (DUF488 family)